MKCPACHGSGTYTLETRHFSDPNHGFFYVERGRKCKDNTCAHRFRTIEVDTTTFAQFYHPETSANSD